MIPVCNLGQISNVQILMQISHLASCRLGSCKALIIVCTPPGHVSQLAGVQN